MDKKKIIELNKELIQRKINIFKIIMKKFDDNLPKISLFPTPLSKLNNEILIKKELQFYQKKLSKMPELNIKNRLLLEKLPNYSKLLIIIIKLIICLYMCGDEEELIWTIIFNWLFTNLFDIYYFYNIDEKSYKIYFDYFNKIPLIGDIFVCIYKIYYYLFVLNKNINVNKISFSFIKIIMELISYIKSFIVPIYSYWNYIKIINSKYDKDIIFGLNMTVIYMIFEKNISLISNLTMKKIPLLEYNLFLILEKIRVFDFKNGNFCNLCLGFEEDYLHILK